MWKWWIYLYQNWSQRICLVFCSDQLIQVIHSCQNYHKQKNRHRSTHLMQTDIMHGTPFKTFENIHAANLMLHLRNSQNCQTVKMCCSDIMAKHLHVAFVQRSLNERWIVIYAEFTHIIFLYGIIRHLNWLHFKLLLYTFVAFLHTHSANNKIERRLNLEPSAIVIFFTQTNPVSFGKRIVSNVRPPVGFLCAGRYEN